MREIESPKRAKELAKAGRKEVEPTGADDGCIKPGDFLGAILRSVNWGVGIHLV